MNIATPRPQPDLATLTRETVFEDYYEDADADVGRLLQRLQAEAAALDAQGAIRLAGTRTTHPTHVRVRMPYRISVAGALGLGYSHADLAATLAAQGWGSPEAIAARLAAIAD